LRVADILLKEPTRTWHRIPSSGEEDRSFLEAYFDPHAM
jgi:hypothetical protein